MNPSPPSSFADFDTFVHHTLHDWHVPGMAIGIIQNDQIVLCQGYGLRDVEQNLPVTPNTLFGIASVSKAFTTFALALLVERGQLDWDRPVQDYIPWFRLQDPAASQITPRDLVSHRSGLPRHDRAWYKSGSNREEIVRQLAALPPSRPFRSFYQYQNMMFVAAGFLLEQITGESWESFIQREIFDPLGMCRSNFSVETSQQMEDVALPYSDSHEMQAGFDKQREQAPGITRIPFANVDALGPAGSINAPISEMLPWLRLHMNAGQLDGQRLISAPALQETHRPQMLIEEVFPQSLVSYPELGRRAYGLGWFLRTYRGRSMVFHSGGIDGYGSFLSFLPQENLGVVILSNLDETNCPVPVTLHIYDLLLGLDPLPWSARYLAHEARLKEAAAAGGQRRKAQQIGSTRPSHPPVDYLGCYTHPGYGCLQVERQESSPDLPVPVFQAHFNLIPLTLKHVHYDTFEAFTDNGAWTRLTFLADEQGSLQEVRLPIEANVAPLLFTRQPDPSLTTARQLSAYAGEYRLDQNNAIHIRCTAQGGLTLQLPGQAAQSLAVVQTGLFRTTARPQSEVTFLCDNYGKPKSVEVLHPDGLFCAVRTP